MKRLLEKYPGGLNGFKGSLIPTLAKTGDEEHSVQITVGNTEDGVDNIVPSDSGVNVTSSRAQRVSVSTIATAAPNSTDKSGIRTPSILPTHAQHSAQVSTQADDKISM